MLYAHHNVKAQHDDTNLAVFVLCSVVLLGIVAFILDRRTRSKIRTKRKRKLP